ncbi:hypothetical protein LPYR103PRE_00590 [Segatella asaccharophila]
MIELFVFKFQDTYANIVNFFVFRKFCFIFATQTNANDCESAFRYDMNRKRSESDKGNGYE